MRSMRHLFFKTLHQRGLLRQTSEKGFVSHVKGALDQYTDFSRNLSDHKMFIKDGVLNWNMMMQAKSRENGDFNNGFSKTETQLEYQKRLQTTAQFIAYNIVVNPSINCIALQEAPVNEVDLQVFTQALNECLPSEWKVQFASLYVDHTSWGIFTIFNKDKIKCDEITREEILKAVPVKDIEIRCRTFSLSQKEQPKKRLVTMLHLPHNAPKEAFAHVFSNILNITKNQEYECHDIVGDFNIDPSTLKDIIDEVLNNFANEQLQAFDINVDICPSIDGHLDANGESLTVDHKITLSMTPSKNPRYSVNYSDRSAYSLLSMFMVISLTGPGMMFSSTLNEEEESDKAVVSSNWRNIF